MIMVLLFLFVEWMGREGEFAIAKLVTKWKRPIRWSFYMALLVLIYWYGDNEQQFIYFQF